MQLTKPVSKLFILSFIMFVPFTLLANDEYEELLNHYMKYETAKIDDFSLASGFNIVYMPDQSLSEVFSKQISSFLEKKEISTTVGSTLEGQRNIFVNCVDLIEGYGRGEDAYKVKITKNNVFVEFTSSKSLYWAYDALVKQYNVDSSIKSRVLKSKKKAFKEGFLVNNDGVKTGSEIVNLSGNLFTEENIKNQINNAIGSNATTIFLELLTSEGCKIKCSTMELFNPNVQYASGDAMSIEEFNRICEYADEMGVTIIPVLDFSNSNNEPLTQFTGHQVFTVEGLRFGRALLKEFSEKATFSTLCLGKKVEDELIQKKYINPLISIANSYDKRVVAW
ncbi:MAG: hypothetical protein R3Y26_05945 [Rikenellaceae bacterium]